MKTRLVSFLIAGAALAAGVLTSQAGASIAIGSKQNVQIGGFFSQGYLYSSENNYPTASKGGTWDFREMAFNVSTTVGSHLRLGGQAFAQTFGNLGEDKVILDWAVADYNVSPYFGVRVGRVKYPKGLYGEALDLDVVRPFVFLPNAVYSPVLRDFSASFDGAMIYGSVNAAGGSFDYKIFHGDIPVSPRKGVAEFYNDAGLYSPAGVSKLGMDSVSGTQLTWNTPLSGLKVAYSYSVYKNLATDGPFYAVPAFNLHSIIDRFDWNTFSAEYTWKDWVFAAEWQRAKGHGFGYSAPPIVPFTAGTAGWDGWYASASRRLNERFEIGAYYGNLKPNGSNRAGNDPLAYQNDAAISLRYDFNEHVLFKIEAHRIDGLYQTFNTTRIPNPVATRKDETTVFAAKTTFSF